MTLIFIYLFYCEFPASTRGSSFSHMFTAYSFTFVRPPPFVAVRCLQYFSFHVFILLRIPGFDSRHKQFLLQAQCTFNSLPFHDFLRVSPSDTCKTQHWFSFLIFILLRIPCFDSWHSFSYRFGAHSTLSLCSISSLRRLQIRAERGIALVSLFTFY